MYFGEGDEASEYRQKTNGIRSKIEKIRAVARRIKKLFLFK